ncbi:MAG: phosphatase PAP2 family protein [Verrucomicrobia bacterium]|nr:phosphatase PAP2 family protein [Verrucomicrobiota bacterium]
MDSLKKEQLSSLLILSLSLSIFWITPLGRIIFYPIDVALAFAFHSLLKIGPFTWHTFAFFNSQKGDWLFDMVVTAFFIWYCFTAKGSERGKRIIVSISMLLFFFLVYHFYRYLFSRPFRFYSPSPSLVLPNFIYLSDLVSWVKIKDHSGLSFPSGHGNTIFLFWISIFLLMGKRPGFLALLLSIPFLLPRLVVGAHWFSDYLFGSFPLALFNLSLLFYTPFFYRMLYVEDQYQEKSLQTTL